MKNNTREYTPSNLKGYFTMAIEVQRHAFKESFAIKKLNQSCETLVRCGFCGSQRDCAKCALQWAHEETIKALKDPKEVERRKGIWERENKENQKGYGAYRSFDGKGHKTVVMHQTIEERRKNEINRRIQEMENIAKNMGDRREQKDYIHERISEREKRKAKWDSKDKHKGEKKNRNDSRWQ